MSWLFSELTGKSSQELSKGFFDLPGICKKRADFGCDNNALILQECTLTQDFRNHLNVTIIII